MNKFICKRKCFYKGRVWEVGDIASDFGSEYCADHFDPCDDKILPTEKPSFNPEGYKVSEEDLRLMQKDKRVTKAKTTPPKNKGLL